MATYIKGVQDAVQSLRPPDPNLQFDAQLLATRQAKYDQAHSKLSKMYGTILNSGLSRQDNIQARDEFFKLIESDLHKIAGMDLSKDSNLTKAQNVFKQIYTNDYLVKDMVWTKNYQNEMQRAQEFRNCKKAEDCGGLYWEDGIKYMQYKREEFQNASRDESMGFDNVRYIPKNNMMEKAIKDLEESGLSIKRDKINGKYKITTQNGDEIEDAMTGLFESLYGNNPQMMDMYNVMAYNKRKDWMKAGVASGKYANMEEAGLGYVQTNYEGLKDNIEQYMTMNDEEVAKLKYTRENLLKDRAAGKLDAKGKQKLAAVEGLYQQALAVQTSHEEYKFAMKNMNSQSKMNILFDSMDSIQGYAFLREDVGKAVEVLKHKNEIVEINPEEYAFEQFKFNNQWALEQEKSRLRREEEAYKASLTSVDDAFKKQKAYNTYLGTQEKLKSKELSKTLFNEVRQSLEKEFNLSEEDLKKLESNLPVGAEMSAKELRKKLTATGLDNNVVEKTIERMLAQHLTLKNQNNTYAYDYLSKGGTISEVQLATDYWDASEFTKQSTNNPIVINKLLGTNNASSVRSWMDYFNSSNPETDENGNNNIRYTVQRLGDDPASGRPKYRLQAYVKGDDGNWRTFKATGFNANLGKDNEASLELLNTSANFGSSETYSSLYNRVPANAVITFD